MSRNILGVVLGYIIMFVGVFVGLTLAYSAMGADRAFQTGSYDPSTLWNIVMLAVGVVAAIAAGVFCQKIARSCKATMSLAIVVLVLGALSAGFMLLGEKKNPGPRTTDVGSIEAMTKAQQPAWTVVANPIIGVLGVLIGGRLAGKKHQGATSAHTETD